MKVKFLKETIVYKGLKPYKKGQMTQLNEKLCKKHWVKGDLEILGEHDFVMPEKVEKKVEVKNDKKEN
jgi:hypothetical protein